MEWTKDQYRVTDDVDAVDRDLVYEFLAHESYWSREIPRELVDRSIDHALCFSVLDGDEMVGFARAITDRSTFTFLADVFVVASHRGRGLAKWLCECVLAHPDVSNNRRVLLGTDDAHALYAQLGFTPLEHTERFMDIFRPAPDVYRPGA
jgi:GNAT superfamily N-acetyltransferase